MVLKTGPEFGWFGWSAIVDVVEYALSDVVRFV